MRASIVIRTLDEARHLDALLTGIAAQKGDWWLETIIVDSGSTDGTLEIAARHGVRILHIAKSDFSFGRSLNLGCAASTGDILVFVSGHCIPVEDTWLDALCAPIAAGVARYAYGGQIGNETTNFAERRVFEKYFPKASAIPQDGFFCNNANAAVAREAWARHRFDEALTGLEDMALARALVAEGDRVAYVAEAAVYHLHHESWAQVRRRYEREALALQSIMPEVQIGRLDMWRYILSSIWMDFRAAAAQGVLRAQAGRIVRYRIAQFAGSHAGNNDHRKLSAARREQFFYPRTPGE